MRALFKFSSPLVVVAFVLALCAPTMAKTPRGLATISGTVRDNKGAPLAGALIELIREGANQIVKQTRSAADGSDSARIPGGRYSLRALATGLSAVLLTALPLGTSVGIAD